MILDLPPKMVLPSDLARPAIIRPIEQKLMRPGYLPMPRHLRRVALKELVARGLLTKEQAQHAIFFVPPPFILGGSDVVAVIATAQNKSASAASSYTFNGLSLPGSWTHLFIAFGNRGSGAAVNGSSVTADGNSATYQHRRNASTFQTVELWTIALTGSTDVDIVINLSGTAEGLSVGVVAVTGLQSITGGTVVTDDTTGFAFAPTVAAGGIAIANIYGIGASSASWGGDAIEFADSGSFTAAPAFHSAGYSLVSGTPNMTCTATSLSSGAGFAIPFR